MAQKDIKKAIVLDVTGDKGTALNRPTKIRYIVI